MASKLKIFQEVPLKKVDVNSFDLSHDVKMSFSMGEIVPSCVLEVMPGDKFTIDVANFIRMMPMIAPVMHRIRGDVRFFFVPNRILWPEWEDFITGNATVEHPYITLSEASGSHPANGSLADYIGLPTDPPGVEIKVNPMPLAAYYKIYDDWYRSQQLQTEKFVPLVPGANDPEFAEALQDAPLRRAWMHDYFTSALPTAQQGTVVDIPLVSQDDIPVDFKTLPSGDVVPHWVNPYNGIAAADGTIESRDPGGSGTPGEVWVNAATDSRTAYNPAGSLVVDVQAGATTIEKLRQAFRLQEFLERTMRGGLRYIEQILSHFGVRSSDARLQRAEYLGGIVQNVVVSEVLSTAQSDNDPNTATVPVGQMAGHGISLGGGDRISFRAEEHGWIIGLVTIMPDTEYFQGVHRSFTRFSRLDYPWPTFGNLGEQAILKQELYVGTDNPQDTFGYIPRYTEMKCMPSRCAGEMRDTLLYWNLARKFDTDPSLNADFIQVDYETVNRIFAVNTANDDHIICHMINKVFVWRKLPRFGIPSI